MQSEVKINSGAICTILPSSELRRQPVEGRVSVLIPAYMRPDDLCQTVARSLQQTYRDTEIIVIDDGTPSDAIEQAIAAFPSVTYIRSPQNNGLIAARNFGELHCSGEFIINLDDDSWLENDDDINIIVNFMHEHPDCGVIALNIGLRDQGYFWPINAPSTMQRTYAGCGNVYRRHVIDLVGGYISEFYRQGEELERSLRIMDVGYHILSLPSVRVFHTQSPINRNHSKNLALEAANIMRRELIRAPWWLLPIGLARAIRFSVRHRQELDFGVLKSELLGNRVRILNFVRKYRNPVRFRTYLNAIQLPTYNVSS